MLDENARLIEVVVAKQNEGKVGASLLSLCSRSLLLSLSPPPRPRRRRRRARAQSPLYLCVRACPPCGGGGSCAGRVAWARLI